MSKKISQREARRMRRRIVELEGAFERQRQYFCSEWPSSIVIGSVIPNDVLMAQINTARKLRHAVVVVPNGGHINFFAAELPSTTERKSR